MIHLIFYHTVFHILLDISFICRSNVECLLDREAIFLQASCLPRLC